MYASGYEYPYAFKASSISCGKGTARGLVTSGTARTTLGGIVFFVGSTDPLVRVARYTPSA